MDASNLKLWSVGEIRNVFEEDEDTNPRETENHLDILMLCERVIDV